MHWRDRIPANSILGRMLRPPKGAPPARHEDARGQSALASSARTSASSSGRDVEPDQKAALVRMDMRGSSPAEECLDCIVAFPEAIEQMRAKQDETSMIQQMLMATNSAFEALTDSEADRAALKFVALMPQDLLYRYIVDLTILDDYTRLYCAQVVKYFFTWLYAHRLRTFFILDNALRDDRLLFELSGIVTVTPRRDGTAWPALAAKLRAGLDDFGHVAYIEPDATVNHLDAVRQMASELPCIAIFRNLAPDDPEHEIVNFEYA